MVVLVSFIMWAFRRRTPGIVVLVSATMWAFRQRTPGEMVHSWSGRAPRMVMRMVDAMMEDRWITGVHSLVVVIQSLL